jgi:hypothetical protein
MWPERAPSRSIQSHPLRTRHITQTAAAAEAEQRFRVRNPFVTQTLRGPTGDGKVRAALILADNVRQHSRIHGFELFEPILGHGHFSTFMPS